mgnify:CR=1 FL=1
MSWISQAWQRIIMAAIATRNPRLTGIRWSNPMHNGPATNRKAMK